MPIRLTINKQGYQLEAVYKTVKGSRRVGVVKVDGSTPLLDPETFNSAMGKVQEMIDANPQGRLPSSTLTIRKEEEV